MENFKSKYELLYSGWKLKKIGEDFVFSNPETDKVVTLEMLAKLSGKTKEECETSFSNFSYHDSMFINSFSNAMNTDVLSNLLTKDEYYGFVKGNVFVSVLNKEYEKAKEYLDKLIENDSN